MNEISGAILMVAGAVLILAGAVNSDYDIMVIIGFVVGACGLFYFGFGSRRKDREAKSKPNPEPGKDT